MEHSSEDLENDPEQNISIDVVMHDSRWSASVADLAHKVCKYIITTHSNIQTGSIDILLTDNHAMQNLNRNYRNKNIPTNVLSFNGKTTPPYDIIGNIAISYDKVLAESKAQEKTFENHFIHLTVHGMLHLLGFDHKQRSDAKKMEAKEQEILQYFNISNPYILN